jgi:hypothetical protein
MRTTPLLLLLALGAAACDDSTNGPDPDPQRTAVQADRFGLPAVATVFIPTAQKDAYNTGAPANDRAAFRSFVVSGLQGFGNPTPDALADALLPDIQPFNTAEPTAFLNGRALSDDVITAELGLIFGTNAALNDDHVDANDKAFLATFPYLAAPHLP